MLGAYSQCSCSQPVVSKGSKAGSAWMGAGGITVDAKRLEYGLRVIHAGFILHFILRSEDGHVPTLWLLLSGFSFRLCHMLYSWYVFGSSLRAPSSSPGFG